MYHGIEVIFRRLVRMQMLRQTGGTWCSDRTRLDLDVAGAYEAELVFVGVDRHCAGVVGLIGGTPNRVAEKAAGGARVMLDTEHHREIKANNGFSCQNVTK